MLATYNMKKKKNIGSGGIRTHAPEETQENAHAGFLQYEKEKTLAAVGFEPTPPKRLVP